MSGPPDGLGPYLNIYTEYVCAIVTKNICSILVETDLLYRKQIAATMRSRIPTMGRTTDRRNCNVEKWL